MASPDLTSALKQRALYRKALENPDMEQSQQRADLRFHLQATMLEWENYSGGHSLDQQLTPKQKEDERVIQEFLKSPITSMTSSSDKPETGNRDASSEKRWKDFLKKLDTKRNMLEERKTSTEGKTIDEAEIRDLRREYMEELWVGAVALFDKEPGKAMPEDLILRHNEFLANLYRPNLDLKEVAYLYTRFDELLRTYEKEKPREKDESAGNPANQTPKEKDLPGANADRAQSEPSISPPQLGAAPRSYDARSFATVQNRDGPIT